MTATRPGLVIFDCDGTLVDSQYRIQTAMQAAFKAVDRDPPSHARIRNIIGRSLDQALTDLMPDQSRALILKAGEAFKWAYQQSHHLNTDGAEPLFEGIAELIETLVHQDYLIAVATGNSQRGLDRILTAHGLKHHFMSLQTADGHPSKPHPSMVHTCLKDAGVKPEQALVVGDTIYDMVMAQSANVHGVGVAWGYHSAEKLKESGADDVVEETQSLLTCIKRVLRS